MTWKYILFGLLHGLFWFVQWPMFWISYPLWRWMDIETWFIDTTNNGPYGYHHESKWKHYGKQKWWVALRWCCARNSHWNFRTGPTAAPDQPAVERIVKINEHFPKPGESVGDYADRQRGKNEQPRNQDNPGIFYLIWKVAGKRFFQYSRTYKLPRWFMSKWMPKALRKPWLQLHCGWIERGRWTLKTRLV